MIPEEVSSERAFLGLLAAVGSLGVLVFGSAGRINLPFVWAYLAVLTCVIIAALRFVDADLRKERFHPGPGGIDRNLRRLAMPFFGAHLVVAGLDIGRFHWTGSVPPALQIAGVVGLAASYALSIWAISVNRFFSPVVRIQSERGHHLITDGPNALIRHSGYAAAFVLMFCSGVALGSWWSLTANVPVALLIFRRVLIEDRFLHDNLDGYRDSATRVRYRLIPCVW